MRHSDDADAMMMQTGHALPGGHTFTGAPRTKETHSEEKWTQLCAVCWNFIWKLAELNRESLVAMIKEKHPLPVSAAEAAAAAPILTVLPQLLNMVLTLITRFRGGPQLQTMFDGLQVFLLDLWQQAVDAGEAVVDAETFELSERKSMARNYG